MSLQLDDVGGRIASGLNEVRNDTGRVAFCGPFVLSAITGFPISAVEERINTHRWGSREKGEGRRVVGTYSEEVAAALANFGYRMDLKQSFMDRPRKERPTLWSWMHLPRSVWAHYILAVHKGKEGHWILVKGVKHCDTYTEGKWQFVCDGPHKGCKIMEVFEVRRDLGV